MTEQEKFEAWCAKQYKACAHLHTSSTCGEWDAWQASIASREPMEWQPIEKAPKDGTEIIAMYVHIQTQIVHNAFYFTAEDVSDPRDIGWWSYSVSEVSRIKLDDWMTPTHWMPLPPPPKE